MEEYGEVEWNGVQTEREGRRADEWAGGVAELLLANGAAAATFSRRILSELRATTVECR